jgi:hypothetical protein
MCNYDGQTVFYHEWIGNKKDGSNNGKKAKFLEEIYPTRKYDEIELLANLATDKDIKDLARRHGIDDAAIAKRFK